MHLRPAILLALALAVPAPDAFAQTGPDIIRLKNGEERKGKIIRVTHQGVVYQPPGGGAGELTESLDAVTDIAFIDAPYAIGKGENELKGGNAIAAVQQFERALEDVNAGKARALHKQYALFGIARAQQENRDWGPAISAFVKLIDSVPDTRFKREAYERAIACAQAKRDNGALESLLDKMKKEPGELGKSLASKAELTAAMSSYGAGKYGEARERFDKLSRNPDAGIQAGAVVGVIRCLAAEKKTDELRRVCDTAIRGANDSPSLLGAAYAGLGDIQFERAMESKDPNAYKEALWNYLRTVVRYAPEAGDSTDDYEKSLYRAGKCFEKLRDSLQKPETKKEYTERARALWDELSRGFKGSDWAAKAQKDMAAIK